jgi:hypothetical protein
MTGIPVLDAILQLIMDWRLGIAIIGLAVVAVGLLLKPILPEWSANNRPAIAAMVIGGIVLTMLPTLAGAIIGA